MLASLHCTDSGSSTDELIISVAQALEEKPRRREFLALLDDAADQSDIEFRVAYFFKYNAAMLREAIGQSDRIGREIMRHRRAAGIESKPFGLPPAGTLERHAWLAERRDAWSLPDELLNQLNDATREEQRVMELFADYIEGELVQRGLHGHVPRAGTPG